MGNLYFTVSRKTSLSLEDDCRAAREQVMELLDRNPNYPMYGVDLFVSSVELHGDIRMLGYQVRVSSPRNRDMRRTYDALLNGSISNLKDLSRL